MCHNGTTTRSRHTPEGPLEDSGVTTDTTAKSIPGASCSARIWEGWGKERAPDPDVLPDSARAPSDAYLAHIYLGRALDPSIISTSMGFATSATLANVAKASSFRSMLYPWVPWTMSAHDAKSLSSPRQAEECSSRGSAVGRVVAGSVGRTLGVCCLFSGAAMSTAAKAKAPHNWGLRKLWLRLRLRVDKFLAEEGGRFSEWPESHLRASWRRGLSQADALSRDPATQN